MKIRSLYAVFFGGKRMLEARGLKLALLGKVIFLTLSTSSYASDNRQDLKQLELEVQTFLQTRYNSADTSRVEVQVSPLDPRLILAACDKGFSMQLNDPSNSGGSVTVQTRCEGNQGWSVYVPAQVALFRPMAVASRNLQRGDVIDNSDISIEIVNISQLRQGYLQYRDTILGKELQRSLNQGEAFRSNLLNSPMVIKRGDEVSIEIQAGSIAVTSSGTAMANGRIGERIRVRNGQSERIVSAEVMGAGKVKTSI